MALDLPRLLTAPEVAQILKVPELRVYELARCGHLPSVRLGKQQVRFDPRALDEFIRSGGRTDLGN